MIVAALLAAILWGGEMVRSTQPEVRNCSVRCERGLLIVSDIGPDCQLSFRGLSIDPFAARRFVCRYRAVGTGRGGGQLYYSWNGASSSDRRRWNLPPLLADGKWHEMTVGVSSLFNAKSWFGGGFITDIRLDLCDEPGGRVEISTVAFDKDDESVDIRDCAAEGRTR